MMKRMATVLLCTVLGSAAYANEGFDSQKFVGLELGATKVQGQASGDTSNDISYGLRLGAMKDKWRGTFALNFYDSGVHNVERFLASFDYLFLNEEGETSINAISPYIGLNVGYMNFESVGVDESGLVYGGQVGIIYSAMEAVDLDLGYRYSLSKSDALDHSGDILFGINYKY